MRSCFVLVALLIGFGAGGSAVADNRDISRMNWLAGMWNSEPNTAGDRYRYVYLPDFNGEILSVFMGVANGKTSGYELRTIKEQDGRIILHVFAFQPDLSPAEPVPLRPFKSLDETHINFTDMAVTRTGKNSMTVKLTYHSAGAADHTVSIDLKRTMIFAKP